MRAVAGFDATFSAPKSVSVLWALTQDDRLLEAHDTAVAAALAHLERFGATTRVRARNGRRLHPDSHGSDDGGVPADHVACGRPAAAHARRDLGQGADRRRPVAGAGCPLPEALPADARRPLPVGAAQRTHPPLRCRLGADRATARPRSLGVPAELLRGVLEADRRRSTGRSSPRSPTSSTGRDATRTEWELAAIKREAAVDTRGHKTGNGVAELTTRWATRSRRRSAGPAPTSSPRSIDAGRDHRAERRPRSTSTSIVAALSTGGSTWNRADVVSALVRHRPTRIRASTASSGRRSIERVDRRRDRPVRRTRPDRQQRHRAAGPTADRCGSSRSRRTSPPTRSSPRRSSSSPGRSTPRPTNRHAVDHRRRRRPRRAPGRRRRGVAGDDRLVLVVGPAGAGKTTTLRAAVDDLAPARPSRCSASPRRPRPPVSSNVRPASPSDTLAKLLHEWQRSDRPPATRYRLPAGTTVIVDEAGMVGTPALARLIALADRTRLAARARRRPPPAPSRRPRRHVPRAVRDRPRARAAPHPPLRRTSGKPPRPSNCDAATRAASTPTSNTAASSPARFDEHLANVADLWLDSDRHAAARAPSPPRPTNTSTPSTPPSSSLRVHVGGARPDGLHPHRRRRAGDGRRSRRHPTQRPAASPPATANRSATANSWTVTGIGDDGSLTVIVDNADTAPPCCPPTTSANTSGSATPPPSTATKATPPPSASNSSPPATTRRGAVRRRHPRTRRQHRPRRHRQPRPRRSPRRPRPRPRQRPRRHPRHHPTPRTRRHRPQPAASDTALRSTELAAERSAPPSPSSSPRSKLAAPKPRPSWASSDAQLTDAEHHLAVAQRRLDPYRPAIEQAAAETRDSAGAGVGDVQPLPAPQGPTPTLRRTRPPRRHPRPRRGETARDRRPGPRRPDHRRRQLGRPTPPRDPPGDHVRQHHPPMDRRTRTDTTAPGPRAPPSTTGNAGPPAHPSNQPG